MYNLDELTAMDESRLRQIANDMGMKKADSASPEEMAYHIIENQASDFAKAEAEKLAANLPASVSLVQKRPTRREMRLKSLPNVKREAASLPHKQRPKTRPRNRVRKRLLRLKPHNLKKEGANQRCRTNRLRSRLRKMKPPQCH